MGSPQTSSFKAFSFRAPRNEGFVSSEMRYRGHRIVWDTRPAEELSLWTGKAAVVMPSDAEDVERVHSLGRCGYFTREEDARDCLIQAAKDWIDALEAEKHQGH